MRAELFLMVLPQMLAVAPDPDQTHAIVKRALFLADVATAMFAEPPNAAAVQAYIAEHHKDLTQR